ncbi:MAG: hypothetical protein A3G47_01510 [Candidatus Zambryskibacteria bacterium RIFCSPLOWO2_12_FULL_39_45]|uniref:POTRA domain-containing protein n=3 Tax=Candidatus Zambryskiibacteriota TaxID=1817925 RepID=A0A1G2T9V9_9BACT|nr:MAG: hypothetical protein UT81_C0009G0009 [Parcubacteria group bacterium GW2011_GWA2_40_14]OHA93539.1 MAG: hypothetical protein A2W58_02740 [Candidatus Zambryskibacteria bacterium RIFCSPHIGHO2_02_38_10.5]OHA95270.1 MAG: hypothetical protein A3C63_01975 [Candidatus Zambryskibacteria bacterium RIFCSPHIGHO2_02_FULL_39_82]OHA99357.1 MAG: hypothetical protein A3E32_02750 [Candidatus Zambryskibacteria bacterium RIFCSPHIGHO2_12_FULL_38_37]OHB08645.1 MAG: hypothetical protein A2W64_02230 [Candidatus
MITQSSSHLRKEYLKQKRNRKLARYALFFLIFVFFLSLISYLAHRPSIRISKIELLGGVLITEPDVSVKSLEYLQGSYLWLFPKNNVLLYPRAKLENYLKETFKRILTIDISSKDFNILVIDITERKPVALWCDEVPTYAGEAGSEPTTANCYFMDSNGTIFTEAPQFSGDAYFKYYGLVATSTPIGSHYIASSTEFIAVSDFIETARSLSLQPIHLIAKDGGEFSLVLANGGQIYFDTKESLTLAGQNLEALLRTPALSATPPDKLPIDYIDLRYGNKLFYKLRTQ